MDGMNWTTMPTQPAFHVIATFSDSCGQKYLFFKPIWWPKTFQVLRSWKLSSEATDASRWKLVQVFCHLSALPFLDFEMEARKCLSYLELRRRSNGLHLGLLTKMLWVRFQWTPIFKRKPLVLFCAMSVHSEKSPSKADSVDWDNSNNQMLKQLEKEV